MQAHKDWPFGMAVYVARAFEVVCKLDADLSVAMVHRQEFGFRVDFLQRRGAGWSWEWSSFGRLDFLVPRHVRSLSEHIDWHSGGRCGVEES